MNVDRTRAGDHPRNGDHPYDLSYPPDNNPYPPGHPGNHPGCTDCLYWLKIKVSSTYTQGFDIMKISFEKTPKFGRTVHTLDYA